MTNILQQINESVKSNPQTFVDYAEDFYHNEISSAAEYIAGNDGIKIVSIAGPSGSGKTTTAHILCEKLRKLGEKTVVVSLDDFYLPNDRLPVLEDGSLDIESVNALDIPLMKKCFGEIIKKGKTLLPKYNFNDAGRVASVREVDITNHGIIIAEGLHALNPVITDLVPKENIYKIYISVNSPIVDDKGNKILSSRQVRLIRRVLRDRIFRDTTVNETLKLWKGVVEGEVKHLYCFKNSADLQLKTLHPYEVCVYKDEFLSLKNEVSQISPCADYFFKTIEAVEKFTSLDTNYIPDNSLIREFIGNGKYIH